MGPAPAGSIATALIAALGEPEAEAEDDGASAGAMAVQSSSGGAPQLRFYALDALGSVRVVFDGHGNVIGRADYEPFGATVATSTTGTLPRQRFTGQERDGEVGTDYFGARMYIPQHGRMLSTDPLYTGAVGDPQRWNRYAYALNSPAVMVDPDGRCTESSTDTSATVCGTPGNADTQYAFPTTYMYSPTLGNCGVSSHEGCNYYDWSYGSGYRPDPQGGQRVSFPIVETKMFGLIVTNDETGKIIVKEDPGAGIGDIPIPGGGGLMVGAVAKVGPTAASFAARQAARYADDLAAAIERFSGKAAKLEWHHLHPKYLGGAATGAMVQINAAYHQVITNAFRTLQPYGERVTPARAAEVMKQVYKDHPIPPGALRK